MGVGEDFQTFCRNLTVSNQDTISSRYKSITRRLNLEYWDTSSETSHSLYLGSYGRNTAIRGFSDLDMLFLLPTHVYWRFKNYTGNGPSALLQEVRRAISKTYPTTEIGGDGQVVVVPFTDGITFEVLPAFLNGDNISYTHPDSHSGGSWKTTNPRPELDAIAARDRALNGNLRRLGRMMRAWRGKHDVPIKGLLIDTLAYRFLGNWEYREKSYLYYDYMTRDFLKYLSEQDPAKEYWEVPGSGSRVYRTGNFETMAKRGYDLASDAIGLEHTSGARYKWRELFGTSYPAA